MIFGRTLTWVALLWAGVVAGARADFIISADDVDHGGSVRRIGRDGSLRVPYQVAPDDRDFESMGNTHAVTPDENTLYVFTNSLGYSRVIVAFDVDSGAHVPTATLHSGFIPPPNSDDYIYRARQALIRRNDPVGFGDLFVISNVDYSATESVIKRYNRTTDSYVETVSPPSPQLIYDFAFGPDNRLYMAGAGGIYPYVEALSFPPFPPSTKFQLANPILPAITTATGSIAFGPDGLLYVRNINTGDVDRYTLAGAPLGTFIPASAIADLAQFDPLHLAGRGSIQFGPDGDLYLYQHGANNIGRFSGATGQLKSTTPILSFAAYGRITVLAVPEPAGALIFLAACGLAIVTRRHPRHGTARLQ